MTTHPLRINLLLLLGYSVVFMIIGQWVDIISVHWFTLILHAVVLFVLGRRQILRKGSKATGQQMFLAASMVLLVGHGLCFFNGLLHFNVH
jgi:4-hydroxybenzoate polyprenyltransferase